MNLISSIPERRFPKKILMVTDTMGGIWDYSLELTRMLQSNGIHVILATMGARLSREQRLEADTIPNLELYESGFKSESVEHSEYEIREAGEWLLMLEKICNPELIHLNGYFYGTLEWNAPVLLFAHSCHVSWWHAIKGDEPPASWEAYRKRVSDCLDAAGLVVTPSETLLHDLQSHYGFSSSRVIHNGGDIHSFQSDAKQDFIFSVGKLKDKTNNFDLLDGIASRLDWPIYVAEDRGFSDIISMRSEEYQRLNMLGELSLVRLAFWLSKATIFALPARYELFGNSLLQAASSGSVLVLGDIPSLRENWNGAAIFVPPNDPAAWEWVIQDLIKDIHERFEWSSRARERALKLNSSKMAEAYLDVYENLLVSHHMESREAFV